jgi:hypothetical protein
MIPVLTFRDPMYRDKTSCHPIGYSYRLINKITKILFTTYEKKSRANLANM